MTKQRVFIVHGWGGSPEESMHEWMEISLEKKFFDALALHMPQPEKPTIKEWVKHLDESVGTLDKNTFFIGHSIGCQTILRYLETQNKACGGAVFIAPWFSLQGLEDSDEESIAEPWLTKEINLEKVKKNLPKLSVIFSDNDPYVPLSDKEIFKVTLNAHVIVEHDKGHYTEDDGVERNETALKELVRIAKE
jgi:predicted alpha/beta hydrolase family esterase